MDNMQDLYPSRTKRKIDMFERLDPVVYGDTTGKYKGPLSSEELQSFDDNGFLFFDQFFSEDDIAEFRQELKRLCEDDSLRGWDGVIREPNGDEVRSVFEVHKISNCFNRLSRHPRILDRVRQLLGSEVYIHQSRINYKPGFKGKGFNWHSDFETWHAEDGMPRMRAVSCSIILTDNNEFNGPLMLVPGSHKFFVPCVGPTPEDHYKNSLKIQQTGVPDNDSLAQLIDLAGGIEAPKGPAGSMLLFDCNTLHGSNANMSPYPRSNVFFVYNSMENRTTTPYAANRRRPEFLAARDHIPLTPIEE
ncbi:ectoine hydroxylase [Alkalilimnicola ehrlichii]|uniref:Ectoine hydroxylase n=1 Tax=Alkalilimnicola ehrlichii TaxID=351052 RepID=A0A3E0X329_9GAMM|nr:ectoine hydroxylase [Alkalilimnicola ehrlichii]RFA31048.1 ectoine hydroxylase [Alkalilimnicola ehrlichii]RFA39003.1 ectoine hydroxylase [Alkalilimnicola ehrlichii]